MDMPPAATRGKEAPGTPVLQVPRHPEKGTKPIPSQLCLLTSLTSSAFSHPRGLPDLCSEHYSGGHLGPGDCLHVTGGFQLSRHPVLSFLKRPPVHSATSAAPTEPPPAGSLPLSTRYSSGRASASPPLPLSCRASCTGGWTGCHPSLPASWGSVPKSTPLLPSPLLLPSLLAPCFLFPPRSLLSLSFGSQSSPSS